MENDDVDEVVEVLAKKVGKSIGKKDVNNILVAHQKKRFEKKGFVALNIPNKLNRTSINNYGAVIASSNKISISKTAVDKSDARFTAENSLMSAVALLIVVAATHFVVVSTEDPDIRKMVNKLSKEDRMLYDMVSEAHGGKAVFPVKPHLLFSQDDKTVYICEGGSGTEPEEWRLTTKVSIKKRGTNAIYKVENKNVMNGMRVKLHFIMSGIGACAPPCITVTGLNDRELKDDFLVMRVQGLCMGGDGVNMQSQGVGFVLFI